MDILISLLIGYLFGSIPFSQIVSRFRTGRDLREMGSLNVGATNAMRAVGFRWGLLAGVMDFLKGLAALWITRALGVSWPVYLLAGLAAILGHNYPVWLRFRGGKGVATALAVVAWVAFWETLIGFVVGILIFIWRRHILFATLTAWIVLLALAAIRGRPPEAFWAILATAVIMVVAVLPLAVKMLRRPDDVKKYLSNPTVSKEEIGGQE